MQKKIITILISLICVATGTAYSQCDPDPVPVRPGIYPDSATGFPPAFATFEYNLVITVVLPVDTIIPPLPRYRVDSIGIFSIEGLPEGFQVIPNRPSGFWHGGTRGCVLITGRPTAQQVGSYPLNFNVVGFIGGINLPIPHTITFYTLHVFDSAAFGIRERDNNRLTTLRAFPNPSSRFMWLGFETLPAGEYSLKIFDQMQRVALEHTFSSDGTLQQVEIDLAHLPRGLYFGLLKNGKGARSNLIRIIRL
ncbi:MAG TPA: hypothetical protein VLH16_00795 [Bacteroidales bacterium]|nr:hypothetical protein [Bacteroidales bacterium]